MALPVAHSRSHIFQGKPYWVTWRLMTTFPVKRFSNREQSLLPVAQARIHPSKGIPSVSRDVWWHHFRWKGPTRANIAQLPVAHACTLPRKPLRGDVTFDDVTSGSHVGHAQWYILYYYNSKEKPFEPDVHAQNILPVTSFPVVPPCAPPEMWLCLCWYTTDIQR